jgi:3',5'-cyclic AMP phosphodiesterase CpdA
VPASLFYRPTALPDRIVLTWEGDPTTTQAVTWRTSTDVARAFAEIAVAESGPRFTERAQRVNAVTRTFKSNLSKCHVHTVSFKDLEPATTYVYRVGDGVNWSEWIHFRTAGTNPASFSFLYFGDAQNRVRSEWSRVIREAVLDSTRAAFTLHAGDLVNRAEEDGEWGEWFGAGAWINSMIPVIATPGNHEYTGRKNTDGSTSKSLTRHWDAQFAFPMNGPHGLEKTTYYIDYQNLRVVSLNSNDRRELQIPWLETVLSENDRTWTVVTFHHPIFSTGKGRDNPELRGLWKPVFDRYQVDLVLTGHDHTYGRTGLLAPETNVDSGLNWRSTSAGTVYVVSVSGPKMYRLNPDPGVKMNRMAEDTQLYQIVTIDGPTLHYESRTAIGQVYDAFSLTKQPGKPNEMIEKVPIDVAERRHEPSE